MNETQTLQKETNQNPVHDLDSMVNWFALHRDKYPEYADVARRVREDLLEVAKQAGQEEHEPLTVRLELRPPAADKDPDSVFYTENPMPEGTYALISQIYRATDAESNKQEHYSTFDKHTGDSYTVYLANVGEQEVYITEERIDKVTTLKASTEIPRPTTEARIGHLLVTAA